MVESNFMIDRDKLEVVQTRIFDASREKVWEAFTDSNLIPKWWGPKILTTKIEKIDFKVGGGWRFVQKDPEGKQYVFYGEFREIIPTKKVVQTFNFEGIPVGHETVDTLMLKDIDNSKTKMTVTTKVQNIEDLEGMVGSGMESGARESWERLADLVEKN